MLIKKWEGFRSRPYQCSAKVWTIGYGTTCYPDGRPVAEWDTPINEKTASLYLQDYLDKAWEDLGKLFKVPLNAHQREAIESLIYNIGVNAFKRSTLLKLWNSGDVQGAANEFLVWNKVRGKEIPGLTNRRWDERRVFLTPYIEEKPQAPEKTLWQKLKELF